MMLELRWMRRCALVVVACVWCGVMMGQQQPMQQAPPPLPAYDPAIFANRMPVDELASLKQYDGAKVDVLWKDKGFRAQLKNFVPTGEFHYGRDMSLMDALEMVLKGSGTPVQVIKDRYLVVAGQQGPYLNGKGFLWMDLQTGIGMGAFYFQPTNGEPSPAMNVFSKQVSVEVLGMSQLPPDFVATLGQFSHGSHLAPVLSQYLLTGTKKKILLEHDLDYCSPADGSAAPPKDWCEERNAEAADVDMTAAYYVEQTHHATNATAWMISGTDIPAFLQMRTNACGAGPDPLGCRIRMTRQRVTMVVHRPSPPMGPRPRR